MKKYIKTFSLALTLALAGNAVAHENHNHNNDKRDNNNDGYLSKYELIENELKLFHKADRNRNKVLTKYEAKRAGYPKWKFYEIDRNHNGIIRPAEVRLKAAKIFHSIDRNGDKVVTQRELKRSSYYNKDYSSYGTWNDYNDGYTQGYVDSHHYSRYPYRGWAWGFTVPSRGHYYRSPIGHDHYYGYGNYYNHGRRYGYGHRYGNNHHYKPKHKRTIGNGKSIHGELTKKFAK